MGKGLIGLMWRDEAVAIEGRIEPIIISQRLDVDANLRKFVCAGRKGDVAVFGEFCFGFGVMNIP